MTSNAHALLRRFTDRPLQGPRWVMREHRAAHRVWGAHGTTHLESYGRLDAWTEPESMQEVRIAQAGALAGKPVAVHTSSHTASTAEDFLSYADSLEHVTRIGTPTCGSTGQPFSFDLPGAGSARICTKRDTWQDGTDFVGVGVQPHIHVQPSVDELEAGVDRTLAVAIEHLSEAIVADSV
ncbi:MAG: S41 family peptidase [Planctomycetota bacterium]